MRSAGEEGTAEMAIVGGIGCPLVSCKRVTELSGLKEPRVHLFKDSLFTIKPWAYSSESASKFGNEASASLKVSHYYGNLPSLVILKSKSFSSIQTTA